MLYAGDYAPQTSRLVRGEGKETLLLKMFSPAMHMVLVFGNMAVVKGVSAKKLLKDIVQVYGNVNEGTEKDKGNVLINRDGHTYNAYMVGDDNNVVVMMRPNEFIRAAVKDWKGVERYFEKIFGMG